MTTETITTPTIRAHALSDALAQVMPHMTKPDSITPILESVHFDSNGAHLHLVASDRYTIAVARRPYPGEEWAATVAAMHVTYLQSWAEAHKDLDRIELTLDKDKLTASSSMGTITLPTLQGTHVPWRPLFSRHLQEPTEAVDMTALDTQFLKRWAKAGRHLQVTQAGRNKPFILSRQDFLGMQMPLQRMEDEAPTRTSLFHDWAISIGLGPAPSVIDLPLPAEDDEAPTFLADLLRQVLISSQDLYEACGGDDGAAMSAHARAGAHAWIAYRVLQVLQRIDPRSTEAALRRLLDELDGGEFSETAFDAAEKLGHDPEQWIDDYKTARARRAEQARQQQETEAAEAPTTG